MFSHAARYTLMRLFVLFACALVLWLLGLRRQDQMPWLILGSFLGSMVLSWLLLRPFRDAVVNDLIERRAVKTADKSVVAASGVDEATEDAESDYR